MKRSRIKHTAIAIVACASVAAVTGIATGAAAPSSNDNSASNGGSSAQAALFAPPIGPPPGTIGRNGPAVGVVVSGPDRLSGPPVHSELVVPNKSGGDFVTITQDSGKVKSVSGSQLTITEGTEQATYKTATLDIPSDATVLRDGEKAALGDLQEGDQVHVSQAPNDTFVYAADSEYQDKLMNQLREHLKNLPKPPSGFQGGPPPGLPPEPMARRGN